MSDEIAANGNSFLENTLRHLILRNFLAVTSRLEQVYRYIERHGFW